MSTLVVALASDTVRRVVGQGPSDLADAVRRLALLRAVTHPSVAVPLDVEADDDGRVVATMGRLRGDDLGVVRRLRGGLGLGECVAVGIDIAEALGAVHELGLAHGDVSPANVVVTGARCVLVDTLAGASRLERGTAGFSAPERPVAATPAADVYSLGRLLEYLADDAAAARVTAWAAPLCAPEPAARPSAEVAARALRACAEPTPVVVPSMSVAAMVRARALPPEEQTLRLARGRPWRIRRIAVRAVAVAVGALGVGLVLAVVVSILSVLGDAPDYRFLPTIPRSADSIAAPPDVAAAALLEDRIDALAAADADALLATTSATGSAREGDAGLVDRLTAGLLRYESLTVDITAAQTLAAEGNEATVRLTYVVPSHRVWEGETATAIRETVTVVDLDIAWSDGAWRVVASRPRP